MTMSNCLFSLTSENDDKSSNFMINDMANYFA